MLRSVLILLIFILNVMWCVGQEEAALLSEIKAYEKIALGEKLNLQLKFVNELSDQKNILVKWIDQKNRICEEKSFIIKGKSSFLNCQLSIKSPIGYHHQVAVWINGIKQNIQHSFILQKPYHKEWIDYKACVWAHYDAVYGDLMRQAGLNASIGGKSNVTHNDFEFYMDNICYEVFAYYHKRRGEHKAMKELWAKNPNRRVINHRRPSLTDEGSYKKVEERLWPVVNRSKAFRPIFYNIADEIGIADQSAVSDLDWEYSSRDAWRTYLENKYRTLDKLNDQWETNYDTWGMVRAFFPSTHFLYDQLWIKHLLPQKFGDIHNFNKKFSVVYSSFEEFVLSYRKIRTDDEGLSAKGLESKYKKIEKFNKLFNSKFVGFLEAEQFLVKWESWIADQDASNTKNWNLSWWCDWRDYMDEYMAKGLGRARDIGKVKDPEGVFGITGTHHPGVFSGHNYTKLMKNLDYIMPYNIGQSFELMRGLDPSYLFMHPTWQKGNKLKRELWLQFFHGCRGVLIWDNHEEKNKLIDRKKFELTQRGKDGSSTMKEITQGLDQLLFQSNRENNGVAIYHSQASARVNWIHQFINLGRKWMMRYSWHEYKEDERSVLRTSWIKIIEDLYLQFLFISPEQLLDNRLSQENIQLLILPEVWAMGKDEAEKIKEFVKNGGTIIADQFTGLYDSFGKRREKGILDEAFGISQILVTGDFRYHKEAASNSLLYMDNKLKSLLGDAKVNDLNTRLKIENPVSITSKNVRRLFSSDVNSMAVSNSYGKGQFIFLNMDLSYYSRIRMNKKYFKLRKGILDLIKGCVPKQSTPFIRIKNVDSGLRQQGAEIAQWSLSSNESIFAIWRNYQINKEGIGGARHTDNSIFEKTVNIKIELQKKSHVWNQRTGEYYGLIKEKVLKLNPWEPIILSLSNSSRESMSVLEKEKETNRGRVKKIDIISNSNALSSYYISVKDPKGNDVHYYSKDISSKNGTVRFEIPFALNDPLGDWEVEITDIFTKERKVFKVNLKE